MDTSSQVPSKSMAALTWVLAALLALAFTGFGGQKVFGGLAAEAAGHFGYSAGFMSLIGVCEMAGAIGLLVPRLSMWAASGLIAIMAGAVYSHLAAGDPLAEAVPACVLFVLLAVTAWLRSDRALFLSDT